MWDIDHLLSASVLRFLRARNRQGFDIYLLPYAEHGNAAYILLDLDHPMVDVVPQMQAHGHEPCVVLQTSRGLLQAWTRVNITPLEPAVATFISRHLAHTYGGNCSSTDWRHLERLAGFTKITKGNVVLPLVFRLGRRSFTLARPWLAPPGLAALLFPTLSGEGCSAERHLGYGWPGGFRSADPPSFGSPDRRCRCAAYLWIYERRAHLKN